MGVITVVLKRIEHLQDDDTLGKSDPYVKFHLEHDNWLVDKNMGKHKSSKKKNTISPVYDETFKFEGISKLDNLKLYVKVMDDDLLKDDFLGGCEIDIEKLDLKKGVTKHIEKNIDNKRGWFSKDAVIVLEITYA